MLPGLLALVRAAVERGEAAVATATSGRTPLPLGNRRSESPLSGPAGARAHQSATGLMIIWTAPLMRAWPRTNMNSLTPCATSGPVFIVSRM
jgi:hypothetical protein